MSREFKGLAGDFYLSFLGGGPSGADNFFWAEGPFEASDPSDNSDPHLVISKFWDPEPRFFKFKKHQVLSAFELYKKLKQKIADLTGKNFKGFESPQKIFGDIEKKIKSSNESFLEFKVTFEKSKNLINQGHIKKIVPWVSEEIEFTSEFHEKDSSLNIMNLFLGLLEAQQFEVKEGNFPYAFSIDGEGMVGVSPEFLFKEVNKSHFQSLALAGTSHSKDISQDLKNSKDLSEHGFVVQDIVSRLKSFSEISNLVADDTKIWESGPVRHLRTLINFDLDSKLAFRLIGNLHPTAALGGYPRGELLRSALKGFKNRIRRNFFGSPVGVLGFGKLPTLVLVAIRGIEISKNEKNSNPVWVQSSGCGVVEESVLEKEWEELALKRAAVRKFWGLI